jgi:beta-galactosidase
MTDNDLGARQQLISGQWLVASKYAIQEHDRFSVEEGEDALKLTFSFVTPAVPQVRYQIIYTAYFDGRLLVKVNYQGIEHMPEMPVMAIDFKMKKRYQYFAYYGMGPDENYIDRNCGARLGYFETTAQANLSRYLNPQECGNRTGVRYMTVHDAEGSGIRFACKERPFEASVLPYSAYELEHASHMEELPEIHYTWVRLAAKQMGVGGDDSWGAPVHSEYKLSGADSQTLEFVISPI